MTCPDDALDAYLDGELAPDEEAGVRAHLADCERCRDELAAIERVRALVRGLPDLDLPSVVVERVRWVGRRRVGAWAAAAVAAAASVLFLTMPSASDSTVRPDVREMVDVHATSGAGGDPMSRLTPAAIPVSFQEP